MILAGVSIVVGLCLSITYMSVLRQLVESYEYPETDMSFYEKFIYSMKHRFSYTRLLFGLVFFPVLVAVCVYVFGIGVLALL